MSVPPPPPTPLQLLQLVADPQRWELLAHLGASDRRVTELTALTGRTQSLVSYHLGELRAAGLVTGRRSSADRRDTYYRLDANRCRGLFTTAAAAMHPALRLAPAPASSPPSIPGRRRRVLFLCTGNSARSQMAEALLEHRSGKTIAGRSAGSHPKPLHANAVRVMAERGVDIADRHSKHIGRFARSRFDHVVTLCDKVKEVCPEFPSAVTAHWSMADPAAAGPSDEETYPAFVAAADEIEQRVEMLIAQLSQLAHDHHEGSTRAR